jgi:hypothetical protein
MSPATADGAKQDKNFAHAAIVWQWGSPIPWKISFWEADGRLVKKIARVLWNQEGR